MAAVKNNIRIEQRATFVERFRIKNPDGTGVDLTGSTFVGQLRNVAGDLVGTFEFEVADQTIESELGWVTVILASTWTKDLVVTPDDCCDEELLVFDWFQRVTGGYDYKVARGVAYVEPSVTVF